MVLFIIAAQLAAMIIDAKPRKWYLPEWQLKLNQLDRIAKEARTKRQQAQDMPLERHTASPRHDTG